MRRLRLVVVGFGWWCLVPPSWGCLFRVSSVSVWACSGLSRCPRAFTPALPLVGWLSPRLAVTGLIWFRVSAFGFSFHRGFSALAFISFLGSVSVSTLSLFCSRFYFKDSQFCSDVGFLFKDLQSCSDVSFTFKDLLSCSDVSVHSKIFSLAVISVRTNFGYRNGVISALEGRSAFLGGAMDWRGLEPLGSRFMEFVCKVYREPRIFYFAFESEVDARGILQDVFGALEFGPLGEEGINLLLKWKQDMDRPCRRLLTQRCVFSFSHLQCPGVRTVRTLQEDFEDIVRDSPGYVLDLAKRRLKRKREQKGTQRAELEHEQRRVYAIQLAELIKEAYLPVTLQLEMLQDPNKAWVRIFGNRRSKTLKNRLRAWTKFRSWMVAFNLSDSLLVDNTFSDPYVVAAGGSCRLVEVTMHQHPLVTRSR